MRWRTNLSAVSSRKGGPIQSINPNIDRARNYVAGHALEVEADRLIFFRPTTRQSQGIG